MLVTKSTLLNKYGQWLVGMKISMKIITPYSSFSHGLYSDGNFYGSHSLGK